jgi:leucyl aminopeptidase
LSRSWSHFDVYAWNPKPRAHAGGDTQAARALFELLSKRYERGHALG